MDATRKKFALQLPPRDAERYNFAICLAETGEFLGTGGIGSVNGELGWPDIGYMFRKEAWGKGYATEFVDAFLEAWWELPRIEVEIEVDKDLVWGEGEVKDEAIVAITVDDNPRSHKVLRKSGFGMAKDFEAVDKRDESVTCRLYGFAARKPN